MSVRVGEVAEQVRSKNAGPFWVTIDLFCAAEKDFERLRLGMRDESVAAALGVETEQLRRFDLADLLVVKLSVPRPVVQGDIADRDLHGASFAMIVGWLTLE